jgi:hypothetical protein
VLVRLQIKGPDVRRSINYNTILKKLVNTLRGKAVLTLHLRSDLSGSGARQPYGRHLQCLGPNSLPSHACDATLSGGI